MNIYVASSWRNYLQAGIVTILRKIGHEVYDFRHPAPGNDGFSWKAIDPELDKLDKWPPARWREVVQHPIAVAGYELDMGALKRCDACVGVLPFGRSASFEMGFAMGQGKKCFIIAFDDTEPELMFRECEIITEMDELFEAFGEPDKPKPPPLRIAPPALRIGDEVRFKDGTPGLSFIHLPDTFYIGRFGNNGTFWAADGTGPYNLAHVELV